MKKLVFDADGLIKLTKSGIMDKLAEKYECAITKQVYDEAVSEGKKRHYQDAFEIEKLVEKKAINVEMVHLQSSSMLGKGELSTYLIAGDSMIVSDDRKFLTMLHQEDRKFVVPAHVIALLAQKKIVPKTDAIIALNRIKQLITAESYTQALQMLEER